VSLYMCVFVCVMPFRYFREDNISFDNLVQMFLVHEFTYKMYLN
jgi:hypothetical protein